MLDQLRALLNLPEEKMILAEFALGKAEDLIKNYCNTVEIPESLRRVCISLAMDIYRAENLGSEESGLIVKSITQGNVSTSFETKGRMMATDSDAYLSPYIKQLQRFRRF